MIVSLDCNFLAAGPGFLRYARQFAAKRRVRGSQTDMNRLYVLEPMPTPTGTKADHRMPARVEEIEQFAWELAAGGGRGGRQRAEIAESEFLQLAGTAGARSESAPRPLADPGRRAAACRGARAGARHERGAGQRRPDGLLHGSGGSQSGGSTGFPAGPGEGSAMRARWTCC